MRGRLHQHALLSGLLSARAHMRALLVFAFLTVAQEEELVPDDDSGSTGLSNPENFCTFLSFRLFRIFSLTQSHCRKRTLKETWPLASKKPR